MLKFRFRTIILSLLGIQEVNHQTVPFGTQLSNGGSSTAEREEHDKCESEEKQFIFP